MNNFLTKNKCLYIVEEIPRVLFTNGVTVVNVIIIKLVMPALARVLKIRHIFREGQLMLMGIGGSEPRFNPLPFGVPHSFFSRSAPA
jgi:hypothetical protein